MRLESMHTKWPIRYIQDTKVLLTGMCQAHKAVPLHPFILSHKHPVSAMFYTHENYNHILIHTLT